MTRCWRTRVHTAWRRSNKSAIPHPKIDPARGRAMEQIRVSTFAGPGAQPVIHTVPRPKISSKAALIKIGACGVCGTDLHILKGHWPKQLPWPFTLGHELGGVLVEVGSEFT